MLKEQNYSCAICNIHMEELSGNLEVDHCHTSGEIRGLLCGKCNRGIGHFNDDIDILLNTIKYLK